MKLRCPHCNTFFSVDDAEYAAILAQVRTAEFDKELRRRSDEMMRRREAEARAEALEAEKRLDNVRNEAKMQLEAMRAENERLLLTTRLENDKEIQAVKSSTAEKMSSLSTEIERLRKDLENADALRKADVAEAVAVKDRENDNLRNQLELQASRHEADILRERNVAKEERNMLEREVEALNSKIRNDEILAQNRLLELNDRHAAILKAKDEEIEHYKDMRSRLSTKLLGETLEKHCQNMFNRARSQGQFPTAYFEKDNKLSEEGTKGDFIFRDFIDGEEYISIMFEMKTEDDKTATKHRNEDFFAKLDKDRRMKNCEYAVLVTMLEADNDFYNEGIVDVSYRYEKMLVVRPQFFMSVISMLSRGAARGAMQIRRLKGELEVAMAQSVDVTNFERRRDQFVENFSKLVSTHLKKQDDALTALDKAIEAAERQADNLRKIKSTFEASRQKLIRANESAENDFTIKKLVRGNPTMRAKFDEARRRNEESERMIGEEE